MRIALYIFLRIELLDRDGSTRNSFLQGSTSAAVKQRTLLRPQPSQFRFLACLCRPPRWTTQATRALATNQWDSSKMGFGGKKTPYNLLFGLCLQQVR